MASATLLGMKVTLPLNGPSAFGLDPMVESFGGLPVDPFTEEQTSESVDHTVVSEIIFRTKGERHESHAKTSC